MLRHSIALTKWNTAAPSSPAERRRTFSYKFLPKKNTNVLRLPYPKCRAGLRYHISGVTNSLLLERSESARGLRSTTELTFLSHPLVRLGGASYSILKLVILGWQ